MKHCFIFTQKGGVVSRRYEGGDLFGRFEEALKQPEVERSLFSSDEEGDLEKVRFMFCFYFLFTLFKHTRSPVKVYIVFHSLTHTPKNLSRSAYEFNIYLVRPGCRCFIKFTKLLFK